MTMILFAAPALALLFALLALRQARLDAETHRAMFARLPKFSDLPREGTGARPRCPEAFVSRKPAGVRTVLHTSIVGPFERRVGDRNAPARFTTTGEAA